MDIQRKKRLTGGLVASVALATAFMTATPRLTEAQQAPPQGGRGQMGRPGPGRGGPMGMGMGFWLPDLTDAQREQVRAIRQRHTEEMRVLAEKAMAARRAIADAIVANDENQMQLASQTVGSAEADLTFAQGRIQAEILSVLTPEQRAQIEARRKQMQDRQTQRQQRRQGAPPQ